MNIRKFLPNVFLFDSFSANEIGKIEKIASIKNLNKDEILFNEGNKAIAFYIVISGKIRIYRLSSSGHEQTMHIHKTKDLVAEASIFDRGTYPADCAAVSDSTLIEVKGKEFIKLINENPTLSLKLLKAYSKRLRGFVSMVEDLSLQDIKGRFANFLLKNSVLRANSKIYKQTGTKKELASLLGTIPETISRTLKFFKDENIIEESGKEIVVKDIERLKSYVE